MADRKFEEAKAKFKKALELCPDNERYQQLLQNTEKAPELYRQIMQQMAQSDAVKQGQPSGKPNSSAGAASDPHQMLAWALIGAAALGAYLFFKRRSSS